MMIVDTHSHAGINWFEPVEMILHQMNLNGVEKTVLIQHAGNYHNRYIIESVKRFPGRFGAVVWVDVEKPRRAFHAGAPLQRGGCGRSAVSSHRTLSRTRPIGHLA